MKFTLPIWVLLLHALVFIKLPTNIAQQFENAGGSFINENSRKEIAQKHNISIGYLPAIRGDLVERQGLSISGAITLALDEINNDPKILSNVNLVLQWNDTKGDELLISSVMNEMIRNDVSAFFGPEGPCLIAAKLAQSKNIPMFSYKCLDYEASDISTFIRIDPSYTQLVESVISLLTYYDWHKFSIAYEDNWQPTAHALQYQAEHKSMSINNIKNIRDLHKCCQEGMDCCFQNDIEQFVGEIKNKSHIIIYLGSRQLGKLMQTMEAAELLDNGEYMVIYVDPNSYSSKTYTCLWPLYPFYTYSAIEEWSHNFSKRGHSLLVVTMPQLSKNYTSFKEKVRKYNTKEPFNFYEMPMMYMRKAVDIHAAYLYDAVKLYAQALHKLLSEEPELSEEIIDRVASNGTKIIETIVGLKQYKSVTGLKRELDEYGEARHNFIVLALKNVDTYSIDNYVCSHEMVPVGEFHTENFPIFKLTKEINWLNGIKPSAED